MSSNKTRGLLMMAVLATAAVASSQNILVRVNGDMVSFNGAEPISRNGRVFVPLRGVFEAMGAFVDWNPATRTVTAQRGAKDVRLTIGDRYATVDGQTLFMDAPAAMIQGRTMVPLRFLSESLGADVQWVAAERVVDISTGAVTFNENSRNRNRNRDWNRDRNRDRNRNQDTNNVRTEVMINSGTVIPVRLDTTLSSNGSRKGDRFTATVRGTNDTYAGLPEGTKIEGRVADVVAKDGDQPGMIELDFNRAVLPDGRTAVIDGSLIGLDDKSVIRNADGTFTARSQNKDNRVVYAGYGAGAGLLVGLLGKKPLEGALLGGVLGFILGQVQKDQRNPSNVYLKEGTEFGVRLNQDLMIRSGE